MESSAPASREDHECPGPGQHTPGKDMVPYEQLACPRHWYQVDRETQRRVWRTWQAGDVMGHAQAIHAAVRQMHT